MLHHGGTREIKTQRLLLRRFVPGDVSDYFAWTGSPEVSRFNREKPHKDLEEARCELMEIINNYKNDDFYMWGIVFADELVGFCCGNEINEEIRSICIGYGLKKQHWNQDIATEATRALIDYFFTIGFNRVFSYHNPLNPASGKVMRKSGMLYEGRIRGGSKLAGEICDCLQYAIVREDWHNGNA